MMSLDLAYKSSSFKKLLYLFSNIVIVKVIHIIPNRIKGGLKLILKSC